MQVALTVRECECYVDRTGLHWLPRVLSIDGQRSAAERSKIGVNCLAAAIAWNFFKDFCNFFLPSISLQHLFMPPEAEGHCLLVMHGETKQSPSIHSGRNSRLLLPRIQFECY